MTTKIIAFLLILSAALITACYICIKIIISSRKKISRLEASSQNLKANIYRLVSHAEKIEQMKTDGAEFYRKIEKAKNDEEINSIVADIILGNNKRVQDNIKN